MEGLEMLREIEKALESGDAGSLVRGLCLSEEKAVLFGEPQNSQTANLKNIQNLLTLKRAQQYRRRESVRLDVLYVDCAAAHHTPTSKGLPAWKETTDHLKLPFAMRAIHALGGGHAVAFSLDLNPRVESAALSCPAHLQRKIVRHLNRALGRDVPLVSAFGYEDHRLHLHGAVATTSQNEIERTRTALRAAGGDWAADVGRQFQLKIVKLGEGGPAEKWGDYILRPANIPAAERVLPARAWTMTHRCRRVAKELYGQAHQRLRDAVAAGGRT